MGSLLENLRGGRTAKPKGRASSRKSSPKSRPGGTRVQRKRGRR
mgnify:CR=1 FL=1|jgi:hypothetical protein|tara:strand:- start:2 stop:133 length:132 start_codon:yes stop_codon:yes gene_type:complete